MPDLTTILRQRLETWEAPKLHPDADTLTAYVEELLPAPERREVLLHISLCNQCRDVVALTMPERAVAAEEQEVAAIILPVPRRAWWFLTPRFGLVASLVAVAVGVTLLLEVPQQNQKPEVTTASLEQRAVPPAPVPAAPLENDPTTFASQEPTPTVNQPAARLSIAEANADRSSGMEKKAQTVAAAPSSASAAAATPPVVVPAAGRRDYVNNQVFANQLLFAVEAGAPQVQELPSAPRPAHPTFAFSQQGTLSGNAIQSNAFLDFSPQGAARNQGTTAIYPLMGGAARQGVAITSKITQFGKQLHLKRLAPAISTENANSYAMFSPGLAKSEQAGMADEKQESTAGPALAQSPAFTSRGMRGSLSALNGPANSFLWKVGQGKLLKSSDMEQWLEGYPAAEGIEFSVVTASGADVWAGGKDAALVHSRDGGLTWERITLGASATGNIITIEVNRAVVQVKSSSGQGWLSQDGGRSWTLQN